MQFEVLNPLLLRIPILLGISLLMSSIQDLGAASDDKLRLDSHCLDITNYTSIMRSFISHSTAEFYSIQPSLKLFNFLVRNILVYSSVMWPPSLKLDCLILEKFNANLPRPSHFRRVSPMLHVSVTTTAWFVSF